VIISDYSSGQPNGKFTEQIPSPPPKPQQKRRIWLLILAILIIAAVAVTSVMPNIQSDAATPTASRQRMVAATSDLQCATRGRIARNQIVTICDGRQAISVLEGPVTSAREMHLLQAGERVTVVGGPACPDGATWWQVRTSNRITGWVDEGDEQVGFYLCPANN
jgi:hypothetical protein